jgi:hypothetical protein
VPKLKKSLSTSDNPRSIDAHKLSLSRDLVDDIELSRLNPEQLLLKASRLARLIDDKTTLNWLSFELRGYPNTELSRKYMIFFNRMTDEKKLRGYWNPLGSLSAWAEVMQTEIKQLRIPDLNVSISSSNPHEWVAGSVNNNVEKVVAPVNAVLKRLHEQTTDVARFREIQSRVMAEIHSFAVQTYYRLAFKNVTDSIFREHQVAIDELLRRDACDVLEKIPAITTRLSEGDTEAISQALNSCRRMIKAFADSVQPPQDGEVEENGGKYCIGSEKVLNRIQYFLSQRCTSKSRKKRIIENLRFLWERVSVGVHNDINSDEARALFLQCYLTLGEILTASSGT